MFCGMPGSRCPEQICWNVQKSWKDSSVHILINGLLSKNAIREAGFVKRSKTYGRVFAPNLTREEYFAATIFSHRYKPQITGLIQALLQRPEVDEACLNTLLETVAELKTQKTE